MAILHESGPRLRLDEFRLLRDLVNERSGMLFEDAALHAFERRLRDRLRALGGVLHRASQRLAFVLRARLDVESQPGDRRRP